MLDTIDLVTAKQELEDQKGKADGIASEIEYKVDELGTIKDSLEQASSDIDSYLEALQGLEDTLENLESAVNEAYDHDISY
tara:strand:- start:223 stop:465 length:243 start_codon:yes stop_codon:yes gene_type:complete